MGKRKYNKAHKDWAFSVKHRDGFRCLVCGDDQRLVAHHLIPWEVEEFRFDMDNGLTLCPTHHTRYGYGLSPHSDGAAMFYFWLFENKPKIYKWLRENTDVSY